MTALPLWPHERAGHALAAVADTASLAPFDRDAGDAPTTAAELVPWLESAGTWLGVEVEAVGMRFESLAHSLSVCAPALIRLPDGILAVARGGRQLVVLDPDLRERKVALADIARTMSESLVAPATEKVSAQLAKTGLSASARDRAAAALVAAQLRGRTIDGAFVLRRPPEAAARAHARDHRVFPRLGLLLALHAIAQALWLGSWWAIGKSVLGGTLTPAWLGAWALLVASSQGARIGVAWWSTHLGIDVGALLSQRLLAGALRGDPDRLKRDGVGIALGRVLESSAVQQLAVSGGLQALLGTVELVLAGVVLALGAGGGIEVLLLVAAAILGALASRDYLRKRRAWARQRLALTHDLAENMVGHATRLAQATPEQLADTDDRALVRYLFASRGMDSARWRLGVLVPTGWPILAAAGLAPVLVVATPGAAALATAIGGMVFATQAIQHLVEGVTSIADAAIAWESIHELFTAAEQPPDAAPPALALAEPTPAAPAIAARGLGYRHAGRGAPVFTGGELVVARGERVLIEGPSGSGKSTLAAILSGLRRPDSGLVLAAGLDRASVGERGWRRRIACAPQFYENHIFTAPLAFNLLVGRSWPPTPQDLAAAEQLCLELGLGSLLARMPGGLFQQVGETGWQLSHGERGRVFLARALLQNAEVVLLDESLAALDPENLAIALRCIEARAPTAIVIAHP